MKRRIAKLIFCINICASGYEQANYFRMSLHYCSMEVCVAAVSNCIYAYAGID